MLKKLFTKKKTCDKCRRHLTRKNEVKPEIHYSCTRPDVFCLGESPGTNEDLVGKPFVGQAGNVLRAVIKEVTDEFIFDNPVRCFSSSKPKPDEIKACISNWRSVVCKHDPKIIVALGNYAAEAILGKKIKISDYIGQTASIRIGDKERLVIFNYHPSYILRHAHKKDTDYERALDSWLNAWEMVKSIIDGNIEKEPDTLSLTNPVEILSFLKWLKDKNFAYDYEAWGDKDVLRPELNNNFKVLSIGIGVGKGFTEYNARAISFPFDTMKHNISLNIQHAWEDLISVPGRIAQNAKYEHKCNLKRFGHTAFLNDTMLAMNVIDELATAKLEAIGCYCKISWSGYKLRMKNIQENPLSVPLEKLLMYSALDGLLPYDAWEVLHREVKEKDLMHILRMQQEFALHLAHVEMDGMHINTDILIDVRANFVRELDVARTKFLDHPAIKKTEKWAKENIKTFKSESRFNPKSTPQMRHLCLDVLKLKVKPGKKTLKDGKWVQKGVSLDKNVLEKFEGQHPVLKDLAKIRSLSAMLSGFLNKYEDFIGPDDCVHTNYLQEVVVTGRLSSRAPDLQNIPLKSLVRRIFNSRYKSGWIIAADYVQIEPVILAAWSGDKLMCDALNSGKDLHRFVGSIIYGTSYDGVTEDQRHIAKRRNLGSMYGQTAEGLAEACNIPLEEAKRVVNIYDQKFIGAKNFRIKKQKEAIRYGFVTDLFGATRHLRNAQSENVIEKERALRQAGNFPIQSTANRFHLIAMCILRQYLHAREIEAVVIGVEHDKIYIDAANHELGAAINTTKDAMLVHNDADYWVDKPVKIKVDIKYGRNLYEMNAWGNK